MRSKEWASALSLAALLLGGCSSEDVPAASTLHDDDAVTVSSRDSVDVEVKPVEPIKLGKNTVTVTFPEHANVDLASVSALMPAHGHGSAPPAIARSENGDGFVVSNLVLYMSGRWELRLDFRMDDRDDEAVVVVEVP
jgi:hypothetical protein